MPKKKKVKKVKKAKLLNKVNKQSDCLHDMSANFGFKFLLLIK